MFVAGTYDVIVVGAGHAGCEAALASARLGCKTLLTTISLDHIALMPCNPSVGGPAKGHLVREIDALGGRMGINIDQTRVQIRMLNTGKGPAVHALRAQADKKMYQNLMKSTLENQEHLTVKQEMVEQILLSGTSVTGIQTLSGVIYQAPCVILATGTYLRSKIIMGEAIYAAGPNGQQSAEKLPLYLKSLGLRMVRFKTGTPPRVNGRSLDYHKMSIQEGSDYPYTFSFISPKVQKPQLPCWLTYTNEATHDVIRKNLHRAPMYSGVIEGAGPRYCPSIETKIVRFGDKSAHQLFVEPEGWDTREMYVQGMSTSLPLDVQIAFLRTIAGFETCEIMRPGYAIEYDCFDPTQLQPTLEYKQINGLFSAGQSNGTSGYEEAAAQGIMAGINAARKIQGNEGLTLTRSEAYIGVLIDDLVTKGTNEPYRMMTSRAEYRLLLRQDNADVRLTPKGRDIGLVDDQRYQTFQHKKVQVDEITQQLKVTTINPSEDTQALLRSLHTAEIRSSISLFDLLKRTEIGYDDLVRWFSAQQADDEIREQIEIFVKYEGYIDKQQQQVMRFEKMEGKKIPADIDYHQLQGLSLEARQKLADIRPVSIGQAGRISGVSPADISVLAVYLEQLRRKREEKS